MAYDNDAKKFGQEFLDDIIQWIADNFQPGDVFNDSTLSDWAEEWAEKNGYTQE